MALADGVGAEVIRPMAARPCLVERLRRAPVRNQAFLGGFTNSFATKASLDAYGTQYGINS